MNVLLVAEESAGVRTLRMLAETPHTVVGVCTSADRPGVRGATVADLARRLGLTVWPADIVTDPRFAARLRAGGVDLLLNVHSLHRIRPEVIEAARIGGFNLHPGPLPRYAGLNAPSWALYHGEAEHAVTVHWLAAELDRGAVAFVERFPIREADTALTVSTRCLELGLPLVQRVVDLAAADPAAIPRVPQDPASWRWFGRRRPGSGCVDWTKPARDVVNLIRACDYHPLPSPWGVPCTSAGGVPVGVLKAARTGRPAGTPPGTVAPADGGAVQVAAADEWVLVSRVQRDADTVAAAEVLAPGLVLGGG